MNMREMLATVASGGGAEEHVAPPPAPSPPPEIDSTEYLFVLPTWLAKQHNVLTKMVGTIERTTDRGILVNAKAWTGPSGTCLRCGRRLTHPVSLLYGVGPECGGHYHIAPPGMDADVEAIKKMVQAIVYRGWLPRAYVEVSKNQ